jgi:flagellin
MALTLNTNIDSLTAQNNLNQSQGLLSQSLTRLSSGLKINSAADDAAGLAISQNLTTQINGTNQAVNNANDAVSEAQTAGGALTTIVNNLQSIRTLAVEAANGSNSASDRQALNQQVQQQIAEVTQIAAQTTFNGASVLSGSSGSTTFQVGANVGNTISINLSQGVQANQIGQVAQSTTTVTSSGLSGGLTIAVGTASAVTIESSANSASSLSYQNSGSAYADAAAINAGDISGLTATASTTVTNSGASAVTAGSAGGTYDLSINNQNIYSGTNNVGSGGLSLNQVVSQINQYSTLDGNVTASLGSGGTGIVLQAADGSNITIQQTEGTGVGGGFTSTVATSSGVTSYGAVTLEANSNITLAGSSTDAAALGTTEGTVSLGTSTLSQQNVLTLSGANATINAVDAALQTVSALQSQLGAIQNRFTAAVSNLTSTSTNLAQSRSTIQDANFAQETANLTQAQVLEQAGISVLSQANQEPQLILKLLS